MNKEDWNKKLEYGNELERDFASCYEAQGYCATFNDDNRFDVSLTKNEKSKTFEIKSDIKSEYTHNYAIETNQGAQCYKSGISVTQSDYWVTYSHQQYQVWCTSNLKSYVLGACSKPNWGMDADDILAGDNCNRVSLVNREKMLRQLPPIAIIPMRNNNLLKKDKKIEK